jgi:hypothetical protein
MTFMNPLDVIQRSMKTMSFNLSDCDVLRDVFAASITCYEGQYTGTFSLSAVNKVGGCVACQVNKSNSFWKI